MLKKVLEESVFHADSYTEPVFSIREFQASELRSIAFGYQDARYGLLPVVPRNEKDRQQVKVCFLTASEMYYEQFRKEEGFCALDKDLFVRKPIGNEDSIKNKHYNQPGQITTISKKKNKTPPYYCAIEIFLIIQ